MVGGVVGGVISGKREGGGGGVRVCRRCVLLAAIIKVVGRERENLIVLLARAI